MYWSYLSNSSTVEDRKVIETFQPDKSLIFQISRNFETPKTKSNKKTGGKLLRLPPVSLLRLCKNFLNLCNYLLFAEAVVFRFLCRLCYIYQNTSVVANLVK